MTVQVTPRDFEMAPRGFGTASRGLYAMSRPADVTPMTVGVTPREAILKSYDVKDIYRKSRMILSLIQLILHSILMILLQNK